MDSIRILLSGKEAFSVEISNSVSVELLSRIGDLFHMSRKTFMSESDIIEFKNKFKEHIFECSEKDTIDKLYEICNKGLEKAHI